jgi:hypothetical protein
VIKDVTVKKGQSLRQNRMKVSEKVPTQEEIGATRHKKKVQNQNVGSCNNIPFKRVLFNRNTNFVRQNKLQNIDIIHIIISICIFILEYLFLIFF